MPKRLRNDPIYFAPDILAWKEGEESRVKDLRTERMLCPYDLDDKIYIYERQVSDWFINRAKSLVCRKQNDFVVMMIAVSYIEGNEQYRKGCSSYSNSKNYFRSGVQRIFNIHESQANKIDLLYKHLRCGLFHNGMSGDAIVLNRKLSQAIIFSDRGTIDINPRLFLSAVVVDFENYIEELRNHDNTELRSNFGLMFSLV